MATKNGLEWYRKMQRAKAAKKSKKAKKRKGN